MSSAAVDRLLGAHAALDLALDGNDAFAIEAAAECYRMAIFDVRAVGVWRAQPDLARKAADLMGRVETAQQRVKNLTRETRERRSVIDAVRPNVASTLYNKSGHTTR